MASLLELQRAIRKRPLTVRLSLSIDRISEMCKAQRPPKMSIPVSDKDDDLYIITTLEDALTEIDKLRRWIREEGNRADLCTNSILGEICDGCRCGKAAEVIKSRGY